MADQIQNEPRDRRKGDRRGGGRRSGDGGFPRPTPIQATAGVLGLILLVIIVRSFGGSEDPVPQIIVTQPGDSELGGPGAPAHPSAATREIYTAAEFEGLLAEGDAAVGQTIRTELYCGSISQVTIRQVEPMNQSLAQLAGADGRVAAAECRWTRDGLAAEMLLIVPPALAEDFARAPEIEINFVNRRRVPAEIEWLGRSGELSLRNAAILRLIII